MKLVWASHFREVVEFSLQIPGNAVLFTVLVAIALHRPASYHTNPMLGASRLVLGGCLVLSARNWPMPNRPRPRRIAIVGARVRLAATVTDLVNVSRTGVLIRASCKLRPGGEWPLVLELPAARVRLTGRVVRCEPAEVLLPGGAALQRQYALALAFVNPSTDAQAVLDQVCGAAIETGECSR